MAYADESQRLKGPINEHATSLAREWQRLTRAGTAVALLTAPAFFLILYDSNHLSLIAAVIITAIAVIMFRGLVELVTRRFIPSPSLMGADEAERERDIVARRRYWYWRGKFRRLPIYGLIVLALLAVAQAMLALGGVSAPFFSPFSGLKTIFPPQDLPQLALVFVQLPLLFFVNFAIFFGPFLFFAVRQIRGYEPGDATWGVKIADVRGQAEAKEEITRVINLWQSGDEFESAGGKRERGLLFLGAPGTGKTMISKAIATNFNCPFVTIPGSGFAGMFIGMDAITVQFLARKARKLAAKWGGQCIVFIDEIDAVGMRRNSLGTGMTAQPSSPADDICLSGPNGALTGSGDVIIENREWRERLFAARAERGPAPATVAQRLNGQINRIVPGMGGMNGMGGGMALNQLLVVMDGIDEPPLIRKVLTNRFNTFLDAIFVVPSKLGKLRLRLTPPKPRKEQIYFIGACNVPIEALDPALLRPGRMGRHIWFRTPTKDDRKDIFDLYLGKVAHEPDLDTDRRRDELARITMGYSPAMIEQSCSMALTVAHAEGRRELGWLDLVDAMTTVETGTAQNVEYRPQDTRAVAIHEAGHAVGSHVYLGDQIQSTRLSIRKRGDTLGHHMGIDREETFNRFRNYFFGRLVVILGAMAAEHVFYSENTGGVYGDVQSATGIATSMVGNMAMGPDPVTLGLGPGPKPGRDAEDTQEEQVNRRLQRIGTRIMNQSAGDWIGDASKRAAAGQLLGQAYVTAYALIVANRAAIEQIADILIERKELYGDELEDLLDSLHLVKPELDLTDPRDMAHGVNAPSPHLHRFRTATAVLVGFAIGAILIAVSVAISSSGTSASPGSGLAWSSWKPPESGTLGARDIAAYISPAYRIDPVNQLAVVTVVNLESASDAAAAASAASTGTATAATGATGLAVAIHPSPTSSAISLLSGNTIAYDLCGVGGKNCAIGVGTPSQSRQLLLRREALELALYTLRYLHGVQNVVAILPPGHTQVQSKLTRSLPTSNAQSKTLNVAVLFDRKELLPLLDHPLSDLLPEAEPPTVSEMTKAPEAGLVEQVTGRGMFSEQLQQAQDGSNLIVLDPLPTQ